MTGRGEARLPLGSQIDLPSPVGFFVPIYLVSGQFYDPC